MGWVVAASLDKPTVSVDQLTFTHFPDWKQIKSTLRRECLRLFAVIVVVWRRNSLVSLSLSRVSDWMPRVCLFYSIQWGCYCCSWEDALFRLVVLEWKSKVKNRLPLQTGGCLSEQTKGIKVVRFDRHALTRAGNVIIMLIVTVVSYVFFE